MPLFLPVPTDPKELGKKRPMDSGAPAWSSQIGACALTTGVVQLAWLLARVHEAVPNEPFFLQWEPFAQQQKGVLLWEAFVTGKAKGKSDEEDAMIGLDAFCAQLPNPGDSNSRLIERPFSLAAAASSGQAGRFLIGS
jgi:hypothetical protein